MKLSQKKAIAKSRIIEAGQDFFYKQGYSKVTMDDIAQYLGMSKKTLYKYFASKYELLVSIIEQFKVDLSEGINNILYDDDLEYPYKLRKTLRFIGLFLSQINTVFIKDLQENLPDVWQELNAFRNEAAFSRFNKLIDEGIRTGYIADDKQKEVIIAMYRCLIDYLISPTFLKQLPENILAKMPSTTGEVFDKATSILFEGILTEEGVVKYKQTKLAE